MRKYHRVGGSVLVLEGPEKGQRLAASSVRMFATDNGYYLRGVLSPRYLLRGPARGPLASGPGMAVPPVEPMTCGVVSPSPSAGIPW